MSAWLTDAVAANPAIMSAAFAAVNAGWRLGLHLVRVQEMAKSVIRIQKWYCSDLVSTFIGRLQPEDVLLFAFIGLSSH